VDAGVWTLVINEGIRQKLGLAIWETVQSGLADGSPSLQLVGLTLPPLRGSDPCNAPQHNPPSLAGCAVGVCSANSTPSGFAGGNG
jgi:hypothetical protein